mmetsp:Transcript_19385/g.25100  ORF Transcript_19385/g.25100 Transcript_19385/m.25100 type:complete len:82 (+) Transcript_19385:135-380(+)
MFMSELFLRYFEYNGLARLRQIFRIILHVFVHDFKKFQASMQTSISHIHQIIPEEFKEARIYEIYFGSVLQHPPTIIDIFL